MPETTTASGPAALALRGRKPFASGGNRWCFVHPDDSMICVKVPHPEVSLAEKRRRKGLKGRLKPASAFDENASERRTLIALERQIGPTLAQHVPRYLGMVPTDMGEGIQVEMIRSADGSIALPLKQVLWEEQLSPPLEQALTRFSRFWIEHRVPSRALLLHNLLVQVRSGELRLWVIDGIGSSDLLPFTRLNRRLAQRKAERKIADLHERIAVLLEKRRTGADPGRHGFLPKTSTTTDTENSG